MIPAPARVALAAVLAVSLAAPPARAEVPAERMEAAKAAITQYAMQMTDLLPCAYIAYSGAPNPAEDMVEKTYGVTAIHETVIKFVGDQGGSAADVAALVAVYADTARPSFTRDIRDLARDCSVNKTLNAIMLFNGPALPLQFRPPFNGK
jgi:hypothetical protein